MGAPLRTHAFVMLKCASALFGLMPDVCMKLATMFPGAGGGMPPGGMPPM